MVWIRDSLGYFRGRPTGSSTRMMFGLLSARADSNVCVRLARSSVCATRVLFGDTLKTNFGLLGLPCWSWMVSRFYSLLALLGRRANAPAVSIQRSSDVRIDECLTDITRTPFLLIAPYEHVMARRPHTDTHGTLHAFSSPLTYTLSLSHSSECSRSSGRTTAGDLCLSQVARVCRFPLSSGRLEWIHLF